MRERREEFDAQLERERRHFHIFLVCVLVLVGFAAIVVVVASIPNDSWVLDQVGKLAGGL